MDFWDWDSFYLWTTVACIYPHNVYEYPCQLHTILLKGDKSCSHFHIQPPLEQYDIIINNGGVFRVIIQHFSKSSSIPPQCVCFHGFYVDGKEFDDTWMFARVCQGFPNHCLRVFCFSSIFDVFPTNLIVFGICLNFLIHTLCTTP
jgi:hypothetical protein